MYKVLWWCDARHTMDLVEKLHLYHVMKMIRFQSETRTQVWIFQLLLYVCGDLLEFVVPRNERCMWKNAGVGKLMRRWNMSENVVLWWHWSKREKGKNELVNTCANQDLGVTVWYNTWGGSYATPMPILGNKLVWVLNYYYYSHWSSEVKHIVN